MISSLSVLLRVLSLSSLLVSPVWPLLSPSVPRPVEPREICSASLRVAFPVSAVVQGKHFSLQFPSFLSSGSTRLSPLSDFSAPLSLQFSDSSLSPLVSPAVSLAFSPAASGVPGLPSSSSSSPSPSVSSSFPPGSSLSSRSSSPSSPPRSPRSRSSSSSLCASCSFASVSVLFPPVYPFPSVFQSTSRDAAARVSALLASWSRSSHLPALESRRRLLSIRPSQLRRQLRPEALHSNSFLAAEASRRTSRGDPGFDGSDHGEEESEDEGEETWRGVGAFADALGIPRNRFVHFASPFTPAAGEALTQELLGLQTDVSSAPVCVCINSSGSESLFDGSLVSPFDTEWRPAIALLRGRFLSFASSPPDRRLSSSASPSSPDSSPSPSSRCSAAASSPPSSLSASTAAAASPRSSLPSSWPYDSSRGSASLPPLAASPAPLCATVAVGRAWGSAALLLACGTPGARAATRNASIALRVPRTSLGHGKAKDLRLRAQTVLAGQRMQAELLAAVLREARKPTTERELGGRAAAVQRLLATETDTDTAEPESVTPGNRQCRMSGDPEVTTTTAAELLRLMQKGVFLTPEEAKALGIIDRVRRESAKNGLRSPREIVGTRFEKCARYDASSVRLRMLFGILRTPSGTVRLPVFACAPSASAQDAIARLLSFLGLLLRLLLPASPSLPLIVASHALCRAAVCLCGSLFTIDSNG
ncbi:ATP-dependent Clp endopeptidase, proteolytic subunit ClpP [Toxoplasma gondii TgCatPRC2]|uniref:ATP-dependent Clp endopeptidase, proteolytic subunit ClpP n=1 Tax=Toxoplasma gondii TgCatPRC2 TaxID=1130821 RepID=A0A151HHD2_TOXGO|nr:ATP-dependent Clp endopeptidase, proteolytic subunit ClpP [Toxoplasma gondii TgCatPRC2]